MVVTPSFIVEEIAMSIRTIAYIIFSFLLLASPIDPIPDFLLVGTLDDTAVMGLLVRHLLALRDQSQLADHSSLESA
jgi:uncharacterized membrane protein YkvA (DUF1232 family)